ncbi:calcium/sodium antiporter [Luteimonas aestuarii]|uniref:Calcium/sodium antiporter n=1 Tax=Luteimonas aestuarii TaxID=453837 RepID=A0A4R5TP75_9GAMM|nr:calcium/sodium antiporter [Luteimonas aestuarii]TDK22702.1 calcium/sodium antiporter [Luteimonas aestuarii]
MLALLFAAGLVLLLVGAEALVRGASRLALALGLAPIIVGLTVVSIGTSAPELAISIDGALSGSPDLALGNIVGSNIANVLLVLGVVALITPLVVQRQLVWLDVPIMIGASVLCFVMALDGHIARWEGGVLLAGAVAYTVFLIRLALRTPEQVPERPEVRDGNGVAAKKAGVVRQVLLMAVGLALLVGGARLLVQAATGMATALGLSELIIGLTVVAVGTSLPEIATSILAAIRGERDLAVGNIVGSNIFNLLLVLGGTALIASEGVPVHPVALRFDLPVMTAVAVACLPIFFTGHCISRWEGAVFVGYYVAYTAYLLMAASSHAALADFRFGMVYVVIPMTVLTIAAVTLDSLKARRTRQARKDTPT